MNGIAIVLHLLAAILWVGGLAFAHFILRPAALPLEPAIRLPLWRRTLARFLPVAGIAAAVSLVTGYWLLFYGFGGFAGAPVYVHIMHLTGLIMAGLYLYLFVVLWPRFRKAVDSGLLDEGALAQGKIRTIVVANTHLGLLTSALGTGRWWL